MPSLLTSTAGETKDFEVGPIERPDPPFAILSSNSGVLTTGGNHGYVADDHVVVSGHLGNPINGVWVVQSVTSNTITLAGVTSMLSGGETGDVYRLTPVDLTQVGIEITFAAKEEQDAISPLVEKEIGSGIAVNSPSSPRKNLATITITEADTELIEEAIDLNFDVWLKEPDGRLTRIDYGIWKIGTAVVNV